MTHALAQVQNFYKATLAAAIAGAATTGNFHVSVLPSVSSGYLVISSANSSKREIMYFSAVGTDGSGPYVTVSDVGDRGLGGTTAQGHTAGETVRMNITAQHQADLIAAMLLKADLAGPTFTGHVTVPTPTNPTDAATLQFVIDTVAGGTVAISYDQQNFVGVAGETLAPRDFVYFKTSDQSWWKADDDVVASIIGVKTGFVVAASTAGVAVTVITSGKVAGFSGLTPGAKYYASATAGGISTSAGANSAFIGWATSASEILANGTPGIYSPTAKQKDFLDGTVGMIVAHAGSATPTGFLPCDGAAVSRATYAALFTAISTAYGVGDGSTTFNVPNLKGATLVGAGQKVKTFTFLDANVNVGTDVITVPTNQYLYTGLAVVLSNAGGTPPAGLAAGTYYVIRLSATTIKLASSIQKANEGTAVNITAAAGGGTNTLTLTLTTRAVGDEGGKETDTAVGVHSHGTNAVTSPNSGGGGGSSSAPANTAVINAAGESDATLTTNMQPFVVSNFFIKT